MNTDLLFIFFIGLLGVGGLSILWGSFYADKKCKGCGNLGDSDYMFVDTDGDYWHYACYESKYKS